MLHGRTRLRRDSRPAKLELHIQYPRNGKLRSRRKLLGTAAVAAAGLAAGFAVTAVSAGSGSGTVIERTNRSRFQGKVLLITGAISGIAKAAVIQFAAEGAIQHVSRILKPIGIETRRDEIREVAWAQDVAESRA